MINTISYFGLKIVFFGFLPDDFSKLYCINPILDLQLFSFVNEVLMNLPTFE